MARPVESATELTSHDFYNGAGGAVDHDHASNTRELRRATTDDNDRSLLVPRLARRRDSKVRMMRLRRCVLCCACAVGFPSLGTVLCMTAYMGGSRNPLLLSTMGVLLPTYTYYVENYGLLGRLARLVDARAAASYARAEAYYTRQRPLFHAAARRWTLHPYFAEQGRAPEFNRWDSTLYDTLVGRLRVMGTLLHTQGRDDFRVEKDKCEMYKFVQRNALPTVPVVGFWYDQEEFLAQLQSGAAFGTTPKWPMFVKFCHLTQGSMLSTRRIKSEAHLHENWDEIATWVRTKWGLHADDITRPWREYSNALTDVVPPGVLVQQPANLTWNPQRGKWGVVEVKVEVVWGRAYLGALLPDDDSSEFPVVMRGATDDDADIEVFDSYLSVITHRGMPLPPDAWYAWVLEPGYMSCVWHLAERMAAIMRADQVRVDIFLTHNQSANCAINEDSLSSGQNYGPYTSFLTRTWLEPWANRWFQTSPHAGHNYTAVYDEIARR